jgi:hypothetical protein
MILRATALAFALLLAAQADTLFLKDGTKVKGRWWSIDAAEVHFLVDNQLQHYRRAEVSGVVLGEGAALPALQAPPAPAPPPATSPGPAPPPSAPATPKPPASKSETRAVTLPPAPARPVREPEEAGPVYFRGDSGDLVALERNQAAERRHGSTQYWEMPNARSPVRLKSAPEMVFLLRVPEGIDPESYSLYPLAVANGARRTEAQSGRKGGPVTVSFQIAKLHDSTYSLTVNGLAPGEYSFSPSSSNDGYCFGVDP